MEHKRFQPSPEQIASWIEANFKFKVRKNGTEYRINNPFLADTDFHFNISTTKANAHDFRSDEWAKGKAKTFMRVVMLYRNCSFAEAVKEVCGAGAHADAIYHKMQRAKTQEADEKQYDIALPPGSAPILSLKDTLNGKILMNWLASRGVDETAIEKYNLHAHSMYVVWPYYEYGMLVYWQQRDRLNKSFLFPPESIGVSKGMFLYGFDMVEPSDYIIITEAIFGSMTLGQQAVASGGAAITTLQVKKIKALNPVNGVILAPDNDAAGLKSLISNYKLISPYYKVFWSVPPRLEYKPGEFIKDWNELYEKKVMSLAEIRKTFEDQIKPLNQAAILQLAMRLK